MTIPEALRPRLDRIGPVGRAAVRPHFMSVGDASPIRLKGQGFVTEELQDHNEIFVDIGSSRVSLVAGSHVKVRRGEDVTVSIDPEHLLLFPDGKEREFEL